MAWITCGFTVFLTLRCLVDASQPTVAVETSINTSTCCEHIEGDALCRESCDLLSLGSSPKEQLTQLTLVARACPNSLTRFWQCINNTFSAVSGADQWYGRVCCELSFPSGCRHACQRAKSREDLGDQCKLAEAFAFFNCLERQEVSTRCCGPATSSQCRAMCKSIFIQDATPTQTHIDNVHEFCTPHVAACVQNYTATAPGSDPAKSLECCSHSGDPRCRSGCQQAVLTITSDNELMDEVIDKCGSVDLQSPLWQCFILNSVNSDRHQYNHGGRIELTGIDGAKLQCCPKALSTNCRQLCIKTYSRQWSSNSNQFHQDCVYNLREADLNTCLQEVEQPCEMGCSGLSYCTNFNNRATELFRSCVPEVDEGARRAVMAWQMGTIVIPNYVDQFVPIKDLRSCRPEVWKAIACTLHIKPCQARAPASQICFSDCISILSECLDRSRAPPSVTPHSICTKLSPPDDSAPCLSLDKFMVAPPASGSSTEISNPCRPSPCPDNEICVVRRRKCKHQTHCTQYLCKKACPMGEVSSFLVPHGSFVRIPVATDENQVNCHRLCKCGHTGLLHKCKDLGCVDEGQCQLRSGRIENHDSQFLQGCNHCACFDSEVTCTFRQCLSSRANEEEQRQYTGLPCNCPSQHVPVCGHSGRSYPSACIARCLGLAQDDYDVGGPCGAKDPCAHEPCAPDEMCIPKRQVCLNTRSLSSNCKQYECVKLMGECNRHHQDPVCDSTGEEFSDACAMLREGRQMGHWGHCMDGCLSSGRVCGMNGEPYSSECEAWANGVPVDYHGPCMATGQLLNLKSGEPSCPDVKCPALPTGSYCRPVTSPGACCPKCAGEIRILFSQTLVNKASKGAGNRAVTIRDVIDVFQLHMSIAECDAFGYISIEGDIVMLIMPVTYRPTAQQIQACMTETEKIGALIASHSPVITSHLPITSFVSADTRTSHIYVASGAAARPEGGLTRQSAYPFLLVLCLMTSFWLHRQSSLSPGCRR